MNGYEAQKNRIRNFSFSSRDSNHRSLKQLGACTETRSLPQHPSFSARRAVVRRTAGKGPRRRVFQCPAKADVLRRFLSGSQASLLGLCGMLCLLLLVISAAQAVPAAPPRVVV